MVPSRLPLGRFGTWYLRVFPVVVQHVPQFKHDLRTFAAYFASPKFGCAPSAPRDSADQITLPGMTANLTAAAGVPLPAISHVY